MTLADRERRWNILPVHPDEDLLRTLVGFVPARTGVGPSSTVCDGVGPRSAAAEVVADGLAEPGEGIAPALVRLVPAKTVPAVLRIVADGERMAAIAEAAARWALAVPAVPLALAVPNAVRQVYRATGADSRAKAILLEGEFEIPVLDAAATARMLIAAGASGTTATAVSAVVADGADPLLVEAATEAVRATATEAPEDGARSAAERLLFRLLESIPETAGRFELNGLLDFRFGNRPAEIDLLCRTPPIAVEIDGYHHFRDASDYRRDRNKDFELQRRGFLVLRFLAEDVLPELESIRDRILSAVAGPLPGG